VTDAAPGSLAAMSIGHEILRNVADHSGHDLSQYRRGRSSAASNVAHAGVASSLADYAWVLRRSLRARLSAAVSAGEASRFFRAPAQLAALRSMVLEPALLA
jgi:hypothetical protein